jgi:hypothetical protein
MTSRIASLSRHLSKMAAKTKTDITLYTVNTPNGIKASILLEELNLDYKVRRYVIHTLRSRKAKRSPFQVTHSTETEN